MLRSHCLRTLAGKSHAQVYDDVTWAVSGTASSKNSYNKML